MPQIYRFGTPIETGALAASVPVETGQALKKYCTLEKDPQGGWKMILALQDNDVVYGLGESMRGINKRGWEYIADNLDDPNLTEDRRNLYGAHNFLIVQSDPCLGIFIDAPEKVRFDIGFSRQDRLAIEFPGNADVLILEGEKPSAIAHEFRQLIGPSWIPPLFAFGFGQSRWGYASKKDFEEIALRADELRLPLDMIFMDIDYMDRYKDFTFSKEFSDFPSFADFFRKQKLHLIPIIDAGVKEETGYDVYEEGVKNNYFVKCEDGKTDFVGAVWPGYALFPDFFNPKAAAWFGEKYKVLTDAGIDGFWNDMNEPALFYSRQGMDRLRGWLAEYAKKGPEAYAMFALENHVGSLKNAPEDYRSMHHLLNGQWISHERLHNLYGAKMSEAAANAFKKLRPGLRTLLFSRSSYIGMHRHSGIWTGDNCSWWDHILLMIHQLPALSMCGFLYSGCDLGGFGRDTTRDLLLRFLQLGVFTPLMRNHSAAGTRLQEIWQFENPEDFRHLLDCRYRLIPWLYSEFLKASVNNTLLFSPLSFVFDQDEFTKEVEDQLMLTEQVMIAPVYRQNAKGRLVWLPEAMRKVVMKPDGSVETVMMEAGHHYVPYALNELVFFLREEALLPLAKPALRTADLDFEDLTLIGNPQGSYELWTDDGISLNAPISKRLLRME